MHHASPARHWFELLGARPGRSHDIDAVTGAQPAALVLSAQPADARSRLAGLVVMLVSMALFVALAPFAKHPLGAYPVFIPLNQTALIINDLITALLLFMQLRVTRSQALLVLACGYLYTALMATAHLLTFPGVFTPAGLLGAGTQTTAYLFVFWHSGFPLAVMAYVFLKRRGAPSSAPMPRVAAPVALTLLLVCALVLLATRGHHLFPPMLEGYRYSSPFNVGRFAQWGLTALAIGLLWRTKQRSVLDVWLLVALCASFVEIGLVAVFNAGRYDLGFYAGRVYALLSSVFVLAVLLFEQARMYSGVFASRALQRAEAQARATSDVLRLAMAGGGMGAWSMELATGRLWMSAEMDRVLGLAPGTVRATAAALLRRVHREDVPRIRRAIAEAIRDEHDFAVEVRFCGPQRRWRWMAVRGRASIDSRGAAAAVIGVVMDVTAEHEVQAALRENDRRKDEFLAILAHELRNPLAPIRNAVEIMARLAPLPPGLERVRGILDSQSRQLSRLVDDLLEVSRITQGKVQLRKARVSVGAVLRDALDATAPAAEAGKLTVLASIEDDGLYTQADAGRLTQVFVNLLHNATKFTPSGGRIEVSARREDAAALVRIRDTGIGIEPEHLDSVFGIFSQVQSSVDARHGGLGIGLALVRGFVELHGGSVQVHSEGRGLGTEFTVRLPLHDPASQAAAGGPSHATIGGGASPVTANAWQR